MRNHPRQRRKRSWANAISEDSVTSSRVEAIRTPSTQVPFREPQLPGPGQSASRIRSPSTVIRACRRPKFFAGCRPTVGWKAAVARGLYVKSPPIDLALSRTRGGLLEIGPWAAVRLPSASARRPRTRAIRASAWRHRQNEDTGLEFAKDNFCFWGYLGHRRWHTPAFQPSPVR